MSNAKRYRVIRDYLVTDDESEYDLPEGTHEVVLASDYAALEKERDQWKLGSEVVHQRVIMTLEKRVREMEADAARYQWLRKRLEIQPLQSVAGSVRPALVTRIGQAFFDAQTRGAKGFTDPKRFELECDMLDDAIDAARGTSETDSEHG